MPFKSYFIDVIRNKYAAFNGRARRSEYWFFVLFKWLIICSIAIISNSQGEDTLMAQVGTGIFMVFYCALIIPSLAVSVRRLHDSGKSGWFILLNVIPLFGGLILLIFYFMDSDEGTNMYGKDPHVAYDNATDHLIESI